MPEVPATNTPVSERDAAAYLVLALSGELGRKPTRNEAAILLGQLWLESARGQSVHNNNPGNLTANDKGTSDFWRPPWFAEPTDETGNAIGWNNERNADLHAKMLKGQAPSAFLAFPSMLDGFKTYVSWIHRKFPSILEAAGKGDPLATARAIQQSGYCPDCNPTTTANTLSQFRTQFLAKGYFNGLPLVLPPPQPGAPQQPAEPPLVSPSLPLPSESSPAHFDARRVVALPVLEVGCAGPAVRLCRVLAGYPEGEEFDDGFRLHLAQTVGVAFASDSKVGPKTWLALTEALQQRLDLQQQALNQRP